MSEIKAETVFLVPADGRLALSARGAAHMVLKAPNLKEEELLREGLKVMRALSARVRELEALKREAEEKAKEAADGKTDEKTNGRTGHE